MLNGLAHNTPSRGQRTNDGSEGAVASPLGTNLMPAWQALHASPFSSGESGGDVPAQAGCRGARVGHMVAEKIACMVHAGILESGDLLPSERELSQTFGVARQTIRSAFATLESGLMISLSHGRRSRVLGPGRLQPSDFGGALKKVSQRSVRELFEARLAVEAQLALLSAALISVADLDRLADLAEQRRNSLGDAVSLRIIDFEFHSCLHQGARNELLSGLALDFYCGTAPRCRQGKALRDVTQPDAQHVYENILAALRSRDPVAASNAMRDHVITQAQMFADLPSDAASDVVTTRSVQRGSGAEGPTEAPGSFWPQFTPAQTSGPEQASFAA
jgi:DNA-binding FadR family transcriptional regulator